MPGQTVRNVHDNRKGISTFVIKRVKEDTTVKKARIELDSVDMKILSLIQADCRITTSKLAEVMSMSETPCWRRVKRLEAEGFISAYQAVLNKEALGFQITAFLHVSVDTHTEEVTRQLERKITSCPEVMGLYNVTGDYDFLIQLVCRNIQECTFFIENTLRDIECVKQIKTSITLREVHKSNLLPLAECV
ncbi:Lrp/AsnC family transcriptional regulator [Pseudomonas sp. MWU13-2517]|uniref:Lrp/AsnC family transcriptional regulator n=1 Tax=Pseudomonas sp. MWU13-2517 TaxID=2929055 RepID=UPI00200BB1DE|nr:Lrp/AsnC family transcriptional regulator [Pseudomonas sp. MWU13-2517]